MAHKFNFGAFAKEVRALAPTIVKDVESDVRSFGSEAKTAAATTATLQASDLAKQIDPTDAETLDAAAAVTSVIIDALKSPPPA